jgi:hypothetical protein
MNEEVCPVFWSLHCRGCAVGAIEEGTQSKRDMRLLTWT